MKDSTGWNRETINDAQVLLSVSFHSFFHFIHSSIHSCDQRSFGIHERTKLQGRYVDVVRAFKDADLVLEVLRSARQDNDYCHNRIYATALSIARLLNVDKSRPRTTGRQQHRGNAPSSSTSEYFKSQLSIPALDYLIPEVSDRFSSRLTATLSQIMIVLPSSVAESTHL